MTRPPLALLLALAFVLLAACGNPETPAKPEGDEAKPVVASAVRGGALYDKFWKVADAPEPKETHPLWAQRPDTTSNARTGSTTWRCKACHGWDYKGAAGAYATGSHKTGFAGVLASKLGAAELLTSLAETHGYRAAGLSDIDLQSLALFLREGLVDTAASIDGQGAFQGDVARGKTLYMQGVGGKKSCKGCHGLDGLKPPQGAAANYDDFVGKVATKNPWEFLHKVRFGQPGSKMPAAHGSSASAQDLADLGAFAQTLPTSK
ncbi:MAG: c-type cytochrome [Planctomycetota bacterium]|nr:c-type cytochrome [Planctomycetota bacterium]